MLPHKRPSGGFLDLARLTTSCKHLFFKPLTSSMQIFTLRAPVTRAQDQGLALAEGHAICDSYSMSTQSLEANAFKKSFVIRSTLQSTCNPLRSSLAAASALSLVGIRPAGHSGTKRRLILHGQMQNRWTLECASRGSRVTWAASDSNARRSMM